MNKYITELSKEELRENIVISCESEDDFPCILIKNSLMKKQISNLSTDNLIFKMNVVLSADDEDFFFHIIKSKKNDFISRQQFKVIYRYIFCKNNSPIDDTSLYELVDSLQEYFSTTPEKDLYAVQIGVFGELLSIKVLYDSGYQQILDKYHKNFYMKHDIEITKDLRVEIKSTENENRIHLFRHNQIYRKDIDLYVISSVLEPSEEGCSVFDMFAEVMKLYSEPDSIFALEKLMKKCGVSETSCGLKFSLNKAISDMKYFNANDLPKIEMDPPKGVSNISYNVDCSFADSYTITDFVNILKKSHLS